MKKYLLIALGMLALTGCNTKDDYDLDATREESKATCAAFGGLHNVMSLTYGVTGKPWEAACINPNTGNTFKVYFKGVLK